MAIAQQERTVQAELIHLEHEWMDGVRRRDAAALDRLLADEFTIAVADLRGPATSRADWLANVLTRSTVESFNFEDMRVHPCRDAAMVQSRYHQRDSFGGQDRCWTFALTDTWARRDGQWQVLARYTGHCPLPSP